MRRVGPEDPKCQMQPRCWGGAPKGIVGDGLEPGAMQKVLRGSTRVPEYYVLRDRMVRALQHSVHQHQEERQGCRGAIDDALQASTNAPTTDA